MFYKEDLEAWLLFFPLSNLQTKVVLEAETKVEIEAETKFEIEAIPSKGRDRSNSKQSSR